MLVIAHRGASAAFAENTRSAFEGAVAQGADGVELDVRRTADRALALSHDDTLPDGTVVVESAFADLPSDVIDLGTALDVCASLAVVNIEIKNWPDDRDFDPTEQVAAEVVALLAARGELDDGRNLISCFHLPTVDRVHELAPGLPTAWLLGLVEAPEALIDKAAAHGHVAVHPHHAFVNEAFVNHAHAAGLVVNTWTCDEPERIRWLADLGVDGVVTNVPDVALAALGR
ncbi:MAG: glycerophosphodiester phosphodiesterase [Acidimicrobiales bacterium]